MKKILPFAFFVSIIWNGYAQTGNVGVGNNTPVTKLDVAGDLALREGTAIAVAGASPAVTVTLHATNSENSFYRITGTPTGTMTLNNIANGVDGQIITLVNATAINLSITNNNAANGILTAFGTPLTIPTNGSVTIQFSTNTSRWYISSASTGGVLPDWVKANTANSPAGTLDSQYVNAKIGIGDFNNGAAGGSNLEGWITIKASSGLPSIVNPINNEGLILQGSGGTPAIKSRLRLVSNSLGWTDDATTTYLQFNTDNNRRNLTLMGGGYGNDVTLNRFQINSDSTQITDYDFGATPVPSSIFELLSAKNVAKNIFQIKGMAAQTGNFMDITSNGGARGNIMTVISNGNVGINITTPQYKLDVNGTGLFRNGNTGAAFTNDQILFGYAGNNTYMHSVKSRHNSGSPAGNSVDFFVWKQGTDAVGTIGTQQVMTIDGANNGSVGIGTTAPVNKLQLQDNSAAGTGIGFTANGGATPTQTRIRSVDNNWSGDLLFETTVPGSGAGALTERMRLKNTGDIQMTGAGNNKLWLETNNWSDPGAQGAGIAADNNTYKTLMIVGNNIAGNRGQNREVQVWDYLKVNGYVTVGTQANATATAPPSGTMRYNTTRNCMEYWDGTYWICMGPPTVQKVTVRDIIDGGYTGTGCNTCTSWAGSYGGTYPFTINNLYAGQKIMFYVEIFLDNDTHKNGAYANAMKIYGGGVFMEDESPSPGWEASITKVFAAQTVTSTGNIGFTFECNQGFTDLRITAVAY